MSFAKKLLKLRKDKELTQNELARRIGVGVMQIRRYEKGTSSPTLEVLKNIAKTLCVSADELIFDEGEEVSSAKIVDGELLEQFEIISRLNPHDKDAVKTILESVIIKNRIEEVIPSKTDAVWSREMRKVISELRKGATKYSQEEIDSIVDEAVMAVRGEKNPQKEKTGA